MAINMANEHLINRTVYYKGEKYTLMSVPNYYLEDVYVLRRGSKEVKVTPKEFDSDVKYDK